MKIKTLRKEYSRKSAISDYDREKMHRSIINSVSHDLKTPLSCIIGSLEIYERAKDKLTLDKRNALLKTAIQEAYKLDSMINNVIDISTLESGSVSVRKEVCVMDRLIDDCLVSLGDRLHESHISIKASANSLTVNTDPFLLKRSICAVLDNAVKYGPAHQTIIIKYELIGTQVVVSIQDGGPGIPKSKLERIFSMYDRSEVREQKSIGFGLPICREIMQLLGGTVTADNVEGGSGTIFKITFAA